MKKTNKFLAIVVCLALALGLAAPALASGAATPYYAWKQGDPQWGGTVLTNRTMKAVGCLVTAVAMLAVQAELQDPQRFDPGVLAAALKRAGGFDSDNNLVWERLPAALPGFAAADPWANLTGSQQEKLEALRRWRALGYEVAVNVRGGGHWVALRSVAGNTAVIMDPAGEGTDLFAAYAASGITRAALLVATRPAAPQPTAPAPLPQPVPNQPSLWESLLGLLTDWASSKQMSQSFGQFLSDFWSLLLGVGKAAARR